MHADRLLRGQCGVGRDLVQWTSYMIQIFSDGLIECECDESWRERK